MPGTRGLTRIQQILLALFCASVMMRLWLLVHQWSVPGDPSATGVYRIFTRQLTTVLVMLLVLSATQAPKRYRNLILLGFLFAIAGRFFVTPLREWFEWSVGCLLLMNICYAAAFSVGVSWRRGDWLYVLPFAAYGGTMLAVLLSGMKEQAVASSVYAVSVTVMGWRATIRCLARRSDASGQAALAASIICFLSDSLSAWNMFRGGVGWSRPAVLLAYSLGQLLIGLSVVWMSPSAETTGSRATQPGESAEAGAGAGPAIHS
jgi:alkenylglycerophosphocholine hydrolase